VPGGSPPTVRRSLAEVVAAQPVAQREAWEVIGIDEFSLRKGRRSATSRHDLGGRPGSDVLRGRTNETVQTALERLSAPDAVAVVSRAMAGHDRAVVQAGLPRAAIGVDTFPVVKRLTEARREVWQRVLRGTDPDDPRQSDGRLVLGGERASRGTTGRSWTRGGGAARLDARLSCSRTISAAGIAAVRYPTPVSNSARGGGPSSRSATGRNVAPARGGLPGGRRRS
jgi:hypothetical protein